MTLTERPLEVGLGEANISALPAEIRGSGRDDIRLMVTSRTTGEIRHQRFPDLVRLLDPGDVLVVNVSATLPAAVPALAPDGRILSVHFAAPGSGGLWSVEVRTPLDGGGTSPGPEDLQPSTLRLRGGATVHLLARWPRNPRLWAAIIERVSDIPTYLNRHGSPIRYQPAPELPIADYQTVFASVAGSSEMPSAGRPFTPEMVTRLVSRGVVVASIVLHTGVSSYEEGEVPGEERYEVSPTTAAIINAMRALGGVVVATGTTVARALETVVDESGTIHPGRGVTDLLITSDREVRGFDALLTGWHEPRSTHLQLLESVMGRHLLERVYREAVGHHYVWHEFGDELLVMP